MKHKAMRSGGVKQIGRGGGWARCPRQTQGDLCGSRMPVSKVVAGTKGASLVSWAHRELESKQQRPFITNRDLD